MAPNSIKISFIGTGCLVLYGVFEDDNWELLNETAARLQMALDKAIFDPSFFSKLNSLKYKSYYDFSNIFKLYGLVNTQQSYIQIQKYRTKRRTICFHEIIDGNTLFPIYWTKAMPVHLTRRKKSIIVVEKDVGTTFTYSFFVDSFNIDNLEFKIANVIIDDNYFLPEILSTIKYDGQSVRKISGDSLISGQFALVSEE